MAAAAGNRSSSGVAAGLPQCPPRPRTYERHSSPRGCFITLEKDKQSP